MAPALNLNKPPTPTTMMTTEPPSSSSSSANDPQQQLLSSSSSTVSQSPIQEDDNNTDTLIGADHSCNNNNAAATSTIQQQSSSSRSNAAIVNPYKKSNPPSSNNSHKDQESNNISSNKRRQFIERYRLQAVHHTQHHSRQQQQQRRGGMSVSKVISSKSALEVLRLNQTWRQVWRRSDQQPQPRSSGDSGSSSEKQQKEVAVALRPRLFLFQRLMQQQQQQQQEEQLLTSQQGVWELGTGITEISGEGGSGKTQICLGLCMNCALTPLQFASTGNSNHCTINNGSSNSNISCSNDPLFYTSIYITMGEGIPQSKIASRLDQMVRHRLIPSNHNNNNHNTNQENDKDEEVERILSRIWLLSLKNEDDFIEFVEIHLPNILNNQSHGIKPHQQQQQPNNQYPISDRIGFIAFDGIANFFRFSDPLFQQFQSSSSSYNNQRSMFHQTRSSKLFQLSSLLRRMSDLYDVPIVITNQVTMTVPSDDGLLKRPSLPPPTTTTSSLSSMGQQDGNHQIQPALGLIWSNCVTTRFILQRKDGLMAKISTENDNLNDSEKKGATTRMQRVRKARVLQSVCTPEESEVWYFIDTGAIVAVS